MPLHRFDSPVCFSIFDNDSNLSGGASWNGGMSRRRFLKRSGGATAATLMLWHASSMASKADDEIPVEGRSDEGNWGPYLQRVRVVWPANGESIASVPFEMFFQDHMVDGMLYIAVDAAPPFGGFPEKMVSVDFAYSVVMTVVVNGVTFAKKMIRVPAHCHVNTFTGQLTSWAGHDPGQVGLPQLEPYEDPYEDYAETDFQLEPNGAVYVVKTQVYTSGSGNGTTVASAKATVEGLGANQTTGIKTTLHVFEAYREGE